MRGLIVQSLLAVITVSIATTAISKSLAHYRAAERVSQYQGSTYKPGDCENNNIYESADEEVSNACELLEM
ncbi:MAG: hypothetical protein ACKOX6_12120 [Bdellovibrio sp.]